MRSTPSSRIIAAVVALLAVAAVGCGGSKPSRPEPGAAAVAGTRSHHSARHHPGLTRLQRALRRWLRSAGSASGAVVYDLSARTPLYVVRPRSKRPPASVEKLYTTVAALRLLGPRARLHTRVAGAGHLTRHGTWLGNLYLRGGGDPTLADGRFRRVWESGHGASIEQVARQIAAAGIRRVMGRVIGDASLFDSGRGGPSSGFAADIPDFGGQLSALTFDHGATQGLLSPGAFAARQLALTLRRLGVKAQAAPGTARAPRHARGLASVSSPPLSTLLTLMNVPSDDLFAEMLTKQLGVRTSGKGTIAAGARAIRRVIATYDLHPNIVDGSGLSRGDRSSPAEVVALLRDVWHTHIGGFLAASLPVVGVNGTVRRIGIGTSAQGRCIAKTGTLNNVTNLAGLCRARRGHTIAFALFLDGPSNERSLQLLTRMVAAITRYP